MSKLPNPFSKPTKEQRIKTQNLLDRIFGESDIQYGLSVFPKDLINELLLYQKSDGNIYLKCLISEKEKRAKPEEIIRQLFLLLLNRKLNYPRQRILIEVAIKMGTTYASKKADIVVYKEDAKINPHIACGPCGFPIHTFRWVKQNQFLKPGGRMAIVLPQGDLNNLSTRYVREWLIRKARILAVAGLGVNTFKPFTGTKTSVLFLQKWHNDKEPLEDYPIFMATSEKSGKDNSGNYIYKEVNGKRIVDSDLDEIADEFIKFAKEQEFSFWKGE